MTELAQKAHVKEIERIVEHLIEDWMSNEIIEMDRYFYNHVVMVETGTNRRIVGVDDVLEQYQLFVEDTEIIEYKITNLLVDLIEDTAVAYVTYRIKYEVKDTRFDESNTEILVFHEHDEEWKIVWRTQLVGT